MEVIGFREFKRFQRGILPARAVDTQIASKFFTGQTHSRVAGILPARAASLWDAEAVEIHEAKMSSPGAGKMPATQRIEKRYGETCFD